MAGRLAGKVCLVTGTGGSIGRATSLMFAREGAAVVGCDVGVEAAEQTVALVHGAGGSMVSLQLAHTTNKAAILGMTRQLAMEGARMESVSIRSPRA
jgi:NADP-dependent 3-hydroxy acid dehydrogenase YdfG